MLSSDFIRDLCSSYGLQMVAAVPLRSSARGTISRDQLLQFISELEEDAVRFDSWRDSNMGAGLEYLNRQSGRDLINPDRILLKTGRTLLGSPPSPDDSALSVMMFCVYYSRAEQPKLIPGYGRVARYAWGRDYHKVLGKRLKALAKAFEQHNAQLRCRGFTDAIPLMERAFGRVAALGFIGKNTLLIQPGQGSFSLLGGIAISAEVEPFSVNAKLSSCGSCSRCLSNCPTGAIIRPYTLDARRCISYLSIEKRGLLSKDESDMLGEWIFGCDICQEVCPFNERALKLHSTLSKVSSKSSLLRFQPPSWKEFDQSSGAGPLLNLAEILMIRSDEQFVQRFQGTPLMRAKREGLLRNAACVAANTNSMMVKEQLRSAAINDSSPVVREHAARAYKSLFQ